MSDEPKQGAPGQMNIQIQADDETKAGSYCNMAMITHTAEEFMADFIFIVPRPPYGKLNARILLSPGHAKRLLRALQDNVARYEKQFGPIAEAQTPTGTPEIH